MDLVLVFDEGMPTHIVHIAMTSTDGANVRVTVSPHVEEAALKLLNPELEVAVSMAVLNLMKGTE